MPSDDAYERIGPAFEPATAAFRSAVTDAIEQVRAYIEAHSPRTESPAARVAAELGAFAAGHIDEERFAALFTDSDSLDTDTLRHLDRALSVLRELSVADGAFRVEVAPGGDVPAGVAAALASIGRAFGAARIAELVRTGRFDEARREDAGSPFPFARWTAAERRIAPPLIVRCQGADLDVLPLGSCLDGAQKIVLVVEGPAASSPLARLITPGTFVMQASDAAAIARMAAFDGPGIAALMPEGSSEFVHDPTAPLSERLVVTASVEDRPRALRRSSVFQQTEAIALLELLEIALNGPAVAPGATDVVPVGAAVQAGVPGSAAAEGSRTPVVDPADTLAAWLLNQAGMMQAPGSAER